MKHKIKLFEEIIEALKDDKNESFKLSLNNVHARGLFSLVVIGSEFGKLTRIFIATRKIKPFDVQLHTHRYPIKLTTIKGQIKHHVAFRQTQSSVGTCSLSKFEYKSKLNGGFGLKYQGEENYVIEDFIIPNGSTIKMRNEEFHTVSCSKGSIWIVEEGGFKTDSSEVLGVPFVVDGLYSQPAMFQINDMSQLVIRELKKIVMDYKLIG